MAADLLQKFLGTNPQRQQEYADFVQRYQDDPTSISDAEAARRYREMMRNAPPDLADQAHDQAFGQLPSQDRRQLADRFRDATQDPNRPFDGYNYNDPNQAADPRNIGRMARQADQQDPNLMDQLLGKNSPLNSTLGRAALAGAAAYIASRVLSGQGIKMPGIGGQMPGTPGPNASEVGGFDKQV
jgi:hypothetical protein